MGIDIRLILIGFYVTINSVIIAVKRIIKVRNHAWRIIVKHRRKRLPVLIILFVIAAVIVMYIKFFNGKFVYFTKGLGNSIALEVKDNQASKMEVDILSADVKKQYEAIFGENIWNKNIDETTFEEHAKEQIKSKLTRVNCMLVLAKERGVVLDRTQTANVDKAAEEYVSGLTSEQISLMDITPDKVKKMFESFAIAQRLYDDISVQNTVEVSADQARVIRIQYIVSDSQTQINEAVSKLNSGESFSNVAIEINGKDTQYECELKRNEMDKAFEDTAYNLKSGEVSEVINCQDKYYIIKCVSDNEKAKTEANKNAIIESQRLDSFNKMFESYEASLYVYYNDDIWKNLSVSKAASTSVSFEDIFNSYFKSN